MEDYIIRNDHIEVKVGKRKGIYPRGYHRLVLLYVEDGVKVWAHVEDCCTHPVSRTYILKEEYTELKNTDLENIN